MATKIYNKCILTTFYYIQHFKFYFLLYVLLPVHCKKNKGSWTVLIRSTTSILANEVGDSVGDKFEIGELDQEKSYLKFFASLTSK